MMAGLAALLLATLPVSSAPRQASAPGRAPFVPGELIVRFRTGSEGARLATSPGANHDVEGALAPVTDRLSREIGLPLTARRALAGGELLVAIGGRSLTHRLLSAARRDLTLEHAALEEVPEGDAAPVFPAVRARLRHSGVEAHALASRLSERLDLPVSVRAGKDREVLISFDADALTLRVLERLEADPDVESARPNDIGREAGGG